MYPSPTWFHNERVGVVLLYVLSGNFGDAGSIGRHDLLVPRKAKQGNEDAAGRGDSEFRMKRWSQRKVRSSRAGGEAPPLLDSFRVALEEGDAARVDFADVRGLYESDLFSTIVQTALEMAPPESGKRSTLEKIQHHLGKGRPSGRFRDATLWNHAT